MTSHKNIHNLYIKGISNYFLQLEISHGMLYSASFKEIFSDANTDRFSKQKVLSKEDKNITLQFYSYLKSPKINWNIEFLWPQRTDFQHQVLNYLTTIPLGITMTYGQVAKELQTSARAVGNACRTNPFPIIIPCHRVVAKNGIGGYDGDKNIKSDDLSGRLAIKYFLLRHERAINKI